MRSGMIALFGLTVCFVGCASKEPPVICEPSVTPVMIGDVVFSGHVEDARVSIEEPTNTPVLAIEFDDVGTEMLAKLTADSLGEALAFTVDGETVMEPKVMEAITGGEVTISGRMYSGEIAPLAEKLAPVCK